MGYVHLPAKRQKGDAKEHWAVMGHRGGGGVPREKGNALQSLLRGAAKSFEETDADGMKTSHSTKNPTSQTGYSD